MGLNRVGKRYLVLVEICVLHRIPLGVGDEGPKKNKNMSQPVNYSGKSGSNPGSMYQNRPASGKTAGSSVSRESVRRAASPKPTKKVVSVVVYDRNPDVVAEVLYRANGHCELCLCLAPFNRKSDGSPYLEVHHKEPLAENGDDTVENAMALCPNCHRKSHYG